MDFPKVCCQLFINCQLNMELNTIIDFMRFSGLKENTEKFELNSNIQAVVGLDFGTTYSGFACCHVSNEEYIYSYDSWSNNRDYLKMQVPTVLDYNYDYYIEFFKLYLGDSPDNLKPKLPVEYKKAITDFFRKISEVQEKILYY